MSEFFELVDRLCSEGVEWRELGSLGKFYSGLTGKSKEDFTSNGNATFITYMNVYSNLALKTDVNSFVHVKQNEKQNTIQYGDVIFTGSSETLDECGMSSVLTTHPQQKLYLNSFCFGYRFDNLNLFLPDFTKHLFRSDEIRKQIIKTANGVTRFNISKKKMQSVKIPLPPLEVQREIVDILDLFDRLTLELTESLSEELELRKKQYAYYREVLLSFDEKSPSVIKEMTKRLCPNGIEYKTLGEVFTRIRGTPITATKMREIANPDGDIRIFAGGKTVIDAFKKDIPKANITTVPAVLVQSRGIVDFVFYEKPFTFKNEMWAYTTNEKITVKFLYYVLKNNVDYFRSLTTKMGAFPQISLKDTETFKIPLPPLEIQHKIVEILDKFDTLTTSLTEGIPAEIEARRKQYTYYRNKLLTFKEKD